jgi:hypothetical protein
VTGAVFEKRASSPAGAERLRREAQVLTSAGHPGLVTLVELREQPTVALLTRRVEGPSLAEAAPLPTQAALALLASVAATLDDLHHMGFVHGALVPEHVLVLPEGRAVLCGLGYGGSVGEVPVAELRPPAEFADPARSPSGPLEPAHDVHGLGALSRWLLARAPLAPETGPSRRRRPPLVDTAPVITLAVRATDPDPGRRPSAAAFADALSQAVGGRSPADSGSRDRPDGARRPRVARLSARLGVALLVIAGAAAAIGTDLAPRAPAPSPPPATQTTLPSCPPVTGPLTADVDGDGCAESLRFEGGIVDAGIARWAVGDKGDQVVTGDWDCDGRVTVAVLHRRHDAVYRFDAWAEAGRDLSAPAIAPAAGVTHLRALAANRRGCHALALERDDGTVQVVR